ncbi:MAG: acetylxylan esterase [Fimbriimonadaceae bacterium]|nr:acetylxylan esterase [Fimbriimonadaceae bacterium]WKZ80506.1 MAG: acetylxylan esterase [Fimbriimonadaceae bacterium]
MRLFEPYVPDDFEAFWDEAIQEAVAEPLDFHRSFQSDSQHPTHHVERIAFRGMFGQSVSGWFAFPPGVRRCPSFLWLAPYGRESVLPNGFGTRQGMASLSFNFHGHDAFHQEEYKVSRGYFAEGAEEPRTWVFRRMIQNAYLAAKVLQAQPEVDEDRIAAAGMSQGGGMSIWLGALCPIVKVVCADMPFLSAIRHTLSKPVHRYPLKELLDFAEGIPLGKERILHTLSYYDTVNMATFCRVPTQVSMGLKDPSVRPECVQATFDALPGPKNLVRYEIGHDWHPAMVPNNREWMLQNLA